VWFEKLGNTGTSLTSCLPLDTTNEARDFIGTTLNGVQKKNRKILDFRRGEDSCSSFFFFVMTLCMLVSRNQRFGGK
jgi:hypothetical protein